MKIDYSKVKESSVSTKGILYILEIDIEGVTLVKVGITKNSIKDRVLQIVSSIFDRYRYFPKVTPKRFSKVDEYIVKEKMLLAHLEPYRHHTEYKFGGYTEVFSIDTDKVVDVYDYLKEHNKLPIDKEISK